MLKMFMKNKKGFTLTELMVVVVILGILVAIAVPVYNNVTTNAQTKAEQSNIRIIEGALQSYISNTGGTYAAITLAANGDVGGTGITSGNLVTDGYLKAMPTQPDGSGTYIKAANGNVVPN